MKTGPSRQGEILAEAMRIIRAGGLGALTMKKVAAGVGISEPAAYRYFPSKEALLIGIVKKIRSALLGPIRELAEASGPAATRLESVVRHHIRFVLQQDGLPVLFIVEAASRGNDELLRHLKAIVRDYMRILEGLLEEMGQPKELATLFTGMAASLAIRRRLRMSRAAEAGSVETLLPFVLSCIGDRKGGEVK